MRWVYLFLVLFLTLFLELFLETVGFSVFLMAPAVFYFSFVYGFRYGMTAAVVGGVMLDLIPGFLFPVSLLSFALVAWGGDLWLRKVQSDSILLLTIPGFFLPVAGSLLPDLVHGGAGTREVLGIGAELLSAGVISAVLFPVLVLLLDAGGNWMSLGVSGDARERFQREEE